MRRSRSGLILVLLALLLIGGGIWLLSASDADDPSATIAYGDDETRVENGEALETEQLEGHAHLAGVGPKPVEAKNVLPPGPVVVTVRGPLGHVLPHLDIVVGQSMRMLTTEQAAKEGVDPDAEPKRWEATTDSEGKAYFEELPRDGSVFVRRAAAGSTVHLNRAGNVVLQFALITALTTDGRSVVTPHISGSGTPIVGESVSLDLPAGIPARIIAVDAADGAPADATLIANPALDSKGPLSGLVDGSLYLAARPGVQTNVRPVRKTSDLYVATRSGSFRGVFSPAAKLFEAQVPVRRSTEVSVTLPPEIDTQNVQEWTLQWRSASARGKAQARLDSYSRLLATGVPYTPGAQVSITAELPGQGHVWASGRFEFADSVLVLEGRFKPSKMTKGKSRPPRTVSRARAAREERLGRITELLEKTEAATQKLGIDLVAQAAVDQAEGAVRTAERTAWRIKLVDPSKSGIDASSFVQGKNGRWITSASTPATDNLGSVRVEVTTPALVRARGALVYVGGRSGKTNDRGVALFKDMKPGTYPVRVFGAGAPVTDEVTVVAKRSATVSVSAPAGGCIEVVLEDEHGHPLPFASLTLKQPSGLPYADVNDELVQRLDLFTDAQGRRTLHSVEPGKVVVSGRYAGRSINQTVDVVDTATTTIKLRIPLEKNAADAKRQLKELGDKVRQMDLEARDVETRAARAALEQMRRDIVRKVEDAGR